MRLFVLLTAVLCCNVALGEETLPIQDTSSSEEVAVLDDVNTQNDDNSPDDLHDNDDSTTAPFIDTTEQIIADSWEDLYGDTTSDDFSGEFPFEYGDNAAQPIADEKK